MPASVLIAQPAGLAIAALVAWLTAATIHTRRHPADRPLLARRSVLLALTVSVATLLLAWSAAPRAHLLLGLLAAAGGAWLIAAVYRTEPVTPGWRRVLVVLRFAAWLFVLVLLGRPGCERIVVRWDRPVLPVLLDRSVSMGITDDVQPPARRQSRAQQANRVLQSSRAEIAALEERYDVRLHDLVPDPQTLAAWQLDAETPVTALAGALRYARELRSEHGHPPPAVVVISDGAENAEDSDALTAAARTLARQQTALRAVGVGPAADETPLVDLAPLVVPPRISPRDVLRVAARGWIQGCADHKVRIAVLWNENTAAQQEIEVTHTRQRLDRQFELVPPGPGTHRLTVRVSLPLSLGGHHFHTSAMVDVGADQIRVLYIERIPRTEGAFVTRAWRDDPLIDVHRELLMQVQLDEQAAAATASLLAGRDVIVLGQVGTTLPADVLAAIRRAVTERGVGLLLAGGRSLFNSEDFVRSPLAEVSPTRLTTQRFGLLGDRHFVLTDVGARHPAAVATQDLDAANVAAFATRQRARFAQLPALSGAADLGEPKPAAEVLARDQLDEPLLVAHEVGAGRCIAAAWETTWPWALASDAGHELHRKLWRQMVVWLANRRPQAWVLTDQPEYALPALQRGNRQVEIRAGVSGGDLLQAGRDKIIRPTLLLQRIGTRLTLAEPLRIRLKQQAPGAWSARLPDAADADTALAAGTYELRFFARVGGPQDDRAETPAASPDLTAVTRFRVVAADLEHRPPTANLRLLRQAAQQTAAAGGRYVALEELPVLLQQLAATDRRRQIRTAIHNDVLASDPWGLLAWLVVLLAAEWIIRKRTGLA